MDDRERQLTVYPLIDRLDRIANALEIIAEDVIARRGQEREALVSQLQYLEREAQAAGELSVRLDRVLDHIDDPSDEAIARAARLEEEAEAAWERVDAFKAAHPELMEAGV